MRRGCVGTSIGLVVLCCVGAAVLYSLGLPRLREEVREPLEQAIGTEVARQLAIAPDEPPAPGTYTMRERELNQALRESVNGALDIDDISTSIYPDGVIMTLTVAEQTATYEGDVIVTGGRLDVVDMSVEGGFGFFLPADDLAEIIENGVNDYLVSRDLDLTDVELRDGEMDLTVAPAA